MVNVPPFVAIAVIAAMFQEGSGYDAMHDLLMLSAITSCQNYLLVATTLVLGLKYAWGTLINPCFTAIVATNAADDPSTGCSKVAVIAFNGQSTIQVAFNDEDQE